MRGKDLPQASADDVATNKEMERTARQEDGDKERKKRNIADMNNQKLPIIKGVKPLVSMNGPKFGTARYYTMRSVYRGRDEKRKRARDLEHAQYDLKPDNKQIADLHCPELDLHCLPSRQGECVSHPSPRGDQNDTKGYVDHYKSRLRLKGLDQRQIYSLHRNKAERLAALVHSEEYTMPTHRDKYLQRLTKNRGGVMGSDDNIGYRKLPNINEDLAEFNRNLARELNLEHLGRQNTENDVSVDVTMSHRELTELEKRVWRVINGHILDDGGQVKRTRRTHTTGSDASLDLISGGSLKVELDATNRKLGNVVSSQRLAQLLSNSDVLKMENFYNFYP